MVLVGTIGAFVVAAAADAAADAVEVEVVVLAVSWQAH